MKTPLLSWPYWCLRGSVLFSPSTSACTLTHLTHFCFFFTNTLPPSLSPYTINIGTIPRFAFLKQQLSSIASMGFCRDALICCKSFAHSSPYSFHTFFMSLLSHIMFTLLFCFTLFLPSFSLHFSIKTNISVFLPFPLYLQHELRKKNKKQKWSKQQMCQRK